MEILIICPQLNSKASRNLNLSIKTVYLCYHIIKGMDQVCVCVCVYKESNKELTHPMPVQFLRKDKIITISTILFLSLSLYMNITWPKIKRTFYQLIGVGQGKRYDRMSFKLNNTLSFRNPHS